MIDIYLGYLLAVLGIGTAGVLIIYHSPYFGQTEEEAIAAMRQQIDTEGYHV